MGWIHSPHGIQGWVNIQALTETPDALAAFRTWWIGPRGAAAANAKGSREIDVLEVRRAGDHLVARLAGCVDREQALALKGAEIAVPRSWLPAVDEGEVYWDELVGLNVVNEGSESLGVVSGFFSNGGHDVLRVKDLAGVERLIPYVAATVEEVDLQAGVVRVRWQRDW
ncbi:MAG: ribosome maturation factor RimM [Burkholderiales bacterium]